MHPEDGMVLPKPTAPECIRHHVTGHERLLLRISFRLDEQLYVPFTFVCHTGAPYLSLSLVSCHVNTASRMQRDVPGVRSRSASLLRQQCPPVDLQYRGEIEIKWNGIMTIF